MIELTRSAGGPPAVTAMISSSAGGPPALPVIYLMRWGYTEMTRLVASQKIVGLKTARPQVPLFHLVSCL